MKLFCVVSILVTFTTAYPSYRLKIPNAWRVPCPDGEEGCSEGESNMNQPESVCNGIGHASCAGGMQDKTLSNFGEDFAAAGFEWTLELCQKDSDGDGQTNGEELGDPCCTWSHNDVESTYMAEWIPTHPGHAGHLHSDYSKPTCEAHMNSLKEHPVTGAFAEGEEQRSFVFKFKNYTVPKERTTYVNFVFNLADDSQDQFHIVYGTAIVDLPAHLHHYVIYGCSKPIPEEMVGQPLGYSNEGRSILRDCQMPLGGFSGWAPGVLKMWDMKTTAGVPFGKAAGIQAIRINTHFTDTDLVEGDVVSEDGLIIHYTPDLRPETLMSTLTFSVGQGPKEMVIPPNEKRYFLTRECEVESSCFDISPDCKAIPYPEFCDGNPQYQGACPVSCGTCTEGEVNVTLVGSFDHAHLTGREMYHTLMRDGDSIDLASNTIWHYDDQAFDHRLANGNITLVHGDKLQTTCVFDTTGRTEDTRFDLETIDEMCFNVFLSLTPSGKMPPLVGAFGCKGDAWVGKLEQGEDATKIPQMHQEKDAENVWAMRFGGQIGMNKRLGGNVVNLLQTKQAASEALGSCSRAKCDADKCCPEGSACFVTTADERWSGADKADADWVRSQMESDECFADLGNCVCERCLTDDSLLIWPMQEQLCASPVVLGGSSAPDPDAQSDDASTGATDDDDADETILGSDYSPAPRVTPLAFLLLVAPLGPLL